MKNDYKENPCNEEPLSLIRDDVFFRLQRKLGLIPEGGLGVGRRALFWSMVAWLPLMVWAYLNDHLMSSTHDDALLQHFGVHVRCLVAIPLFIMAEGIVHAATMHIVPYFVDSGLVTQEQTSEYKAILSDMKRLRDGVFPCIVIAGVILARMTFPLAAMETHELAWSGLVEIDKEIQPGFGGWWFLYVTRSVFLVLMLAWFWRLLLLGILLGRIAKLDLSIVPTHPDGMGGLGFIEELPMTFAPVVFALSAVAAAKWGHGVVFHGDSVLEHKTMMIALVVALMLIFLAPYLSLSGTLKKAKKQALLDYGKLVGLHGRLVRRRWILGQVVNDDPLLSAPEIGPVADTVAIYEAVQNMSSFPIGKKALASVAIPALIPLLVLLSVQVPIKDILMTLIKTLA